MRTGMAHADEERKRPDLDRVREALGEPGERPDRHLTPRGDDPERQRDARERLDERDAAEDD
jgi:hypothetical protein